MSPRNLLHIEFYTIVLDKVRILYTYKSLEIYNYLVLFLKILNSSIVVLPKEDYKYLVLVYISLESMYVSAI